MKARKILNISVCILLILNIIIWTFIIGTELNHNLKYIQGSDNFNLEWSTIHAARDKKQIKATLDNMFGNPWYFYEEKSLSDAKGCCNIMLRRIIIDPSCSQEDYVFALTHELVHLTKLTANERYCNFTAFKLLYQSGDTYFKDIAIYYAYLDCNNQIMQEYSCWGYIEQYLLGV